jgi:hypothetical protein
MKKKGNNPLGSGMGQENRKIKKKHYLKKKHNNSF